jgi:hypothetical protein
MTEKTTKTIYYGADKKLPAILCELSILEVDTVSAPSQYNWTQVFWMYPTVNDTELIYNSSIPVKGFKLPITAMTGRVLLNVDCNVIKLGRHAKGKPSIYSTHIEGIKDIGPELSGEIKDTVFLVHHPDVEIANSERNVIRIKYFRNKEKHESYVNHVSIGIPLHSALEHFEHVDNNIAGMHYERLE